MADRRLKNKLELFHDDLAGLKKLPTGPAVPVHYQEMARRLGGELASNHAGSYLVVRQTFRNGFLLGNAGLNVTDRKSLIPFTCFSSTDRGGSAALDSLLFLDTETTGLGGSGAVAFLVGCGSVTKEGFEIRQYLIPDYSDETAMLEALLDEFDESKTLVSFNGSAFDLPLLHTRMIINRSAREVACHHHLDLLHPARRLFRRRLKDCSLTNLERELFDFHRRNDIPGYLIPSVYFDWLSERRLNDMEAVLDHNRFDVLTLCFLLQHLADIYESNGRILNQVDDLHSLSRLFSKRKENLKVVDIHLRIENLGTEGLADDIVYFRSMTQKRLGQFDQALPVWHKLAQGNSREGFLSAIELAKYLEHREKDYAGALEITRRAEMIAPERKTVREELKRRLVRLKAKIAD